MSSTVIAHRPCLPPSLVPFGFYELSVPQITQLALTSRPSDTPLLLPAQRPTLALTLANWLCPSCHLPGNPFFHSPTPEVGRQYPSCVLEERRHASMPRLHAAPPPRHHHSLLHFHSLICLPCAGLRLSCSRRSPWCLRVSQPTLSAHYRVTPWQEGRALLRQYALSTLRSFRSCKYAPCLKSPAKFSALIIRFKHGSRCTEPTV